MNAQHYETRAEWKHIGLYAKKEETTQETKGIAQYKQDFTALMEEMQPEVSMMESSTHPVYLYLEMAPTPSNVVSAGLNIYLPETVGLLHEHPFLELYGMLEISSNVKTFNELVVEVTPCFSEVEITFDKPAIVAQAMQITYCVFGKLIRNIPVRIQLDCKFTPLINFPLKPQSFKTATSSTVRSFERVQDIKLPDLTHTPGVSITEMLNTSDTDSEISADIEIVEQNSW